MPKWQSHDLLVAKIEFLRVELLCLLSREVCSSSGSHFRRCRFFEECYIRQLLLFSSASSGLVSLTASAFGQLGSTSLILTQHVMNDRFGSPHKEYFLYFVAQVPKFSILYTQTSTLTPFSLAWPQDPTDASPLDSDQPLMEDQIFPALRAAGHFSDRICMLCRPGSAQIPSKTWEKNTPHLPDSEEP